MTYKNTPQKLVVSYSRTAMVFHWLMALGLVANFAFGTYMHELPLSPQKLQYYSWHKWAGITLLGLVTLRLVWRLVVRPPALLPAPAWQRKVAHGLHWLLYILMFAIPLSGWMMSSASGFPVVLFGVWQLPDLVPKDKTLFEALKDVHGGAEYGSAGAGDRACGGGAEAPFCGSGCDFAADAAVGRAVRLGRRVLAW